MSVDIRANPDVLISPHAIALRNGSRVVFGSMDKEDKNIGKSRQELPMYINRIKSGSEFTQFSAGSNPTIMNRSRYELLKTEHLLADEDQCEQEKAESCSSRRLSSILCGPWLLLTSWLASVIIVAAAAFTLTSASFSTYNNICIDSAWGE